MNVVDERLASIQRMAKKRASRWGKASEIETHKRIKVAVAAYAYEIMNESIMPDAEWDQLAKSIDLDVDTANPRLDLWFRRHFQPHTGYWVHNHPNRKRLRAIALLILGRRDHT